MLNFLSAINCILLHLKKKLTLAIMSDLYQVVTIAGKDLGCIANKNIKRGTLISQEKPQCTAFGSQTWDSEWIKSVVSSFNEMSTSDQEKYLKLHNRFSDVESLNDVQQKELINRKDQINKIFDFDGENEDGKGTGSSLNEKLKPSTIKSNISGKR